MVAGFRDGQGLLGPVDGRICDVEPGKSKDHIFSSTAHNVEEMFLDDPFNVGIEDTGIVNYTHLICSLVNVMDSNRGGEFLSGELVFSDKLPVYTRDVCTEIYQYRRVNDFEGVRGGDQLNRDMHRFIRS